jgi:drug/metabolite transporter (DMT)-like permease
VKMMRAARPHGRIALRPPSSLELMLFGTIVLWALNLSMSRYILTHGLQPLAYVSVRYGFASAVFIAIALLTEGTLRIARAHVWLVLAAALALFLNQLAFTYAVKDTSASVIALILAAVPIFAAVIGLALRTEQLSRRFWVGAAVSFVGVALVVLGTGGEIRHDQRGVLLGIGAAGTWAAYSVIITPLMRLYSPARISAVVLPAAWLPSTLLAWPQLGSQDWHLGGHVWLLVIVATLGPLILTNILWFHSLDRIGPARATLATNLQPFLAALFAVVLLSESLSLVQVMGGALIAGGILGARRRAAAAGPEAPAVS